MNTATRRTTHESGTSPLDAVRMLRASSGPLLAQAQLHGQLAQVEWQEQKQRLLRMLVTTLLGFAGLLCAVLTASALAVAASWNAGYGYGLAMLGALALIYAACTAVAWRRLRALAAMAGDAFAASREELAADAQLLKGKL
ncbi:MAG TPA: phage holin family protein [Verrucomicrobiae bacterium]|nr:phage holin family protein [Verrucomicrobiae bacterium]